MIDGIYNSTHFGDNSWQICSYWLCDMARLKIELISQIMNKNQKEKWGSIFRATLCDIHNKLI